jgi:uncharacterized protein YlxP (DUF503 family)
VVIGSIIWQLHLDGCHSLKDKRHVLRSLKDRLRHQFNVSVAETDFQDTWQRAEIAVCVVSGDKAYAEGVLRAADQLVASANGARVTDSVTSYC